MTAALTPEQAYLATVAELNTLAERSKHVTHVDVLRIASMSADELRRRAIVALDWHSCFSHCLDGMPELKAIPGGAPDGCWLPGPVRGVVEALLRRSDLTYEDTSHGRRKSPSPEAQRIEALEAELRAQIDVTNEQTLLIAKLEAELAACKTEIAVERSSRCMFVSRIENCGITPMTGEGVLALLNDCDMLASREFDLPSRLEVTYGDAAIDAAMAAGEKAS